jgi:hypothetical protein
MLSDDAMRPFKVAEIVLTAQERSFELLGVFLCVLMKFSDSKASPIV